MVSGRARRWGAGLAYPVSPKPLSAWISGFFKQQQFLERLGLSYIQGKTHYPQPNERAQNNHLHLCGELSTCMWAASAEHQGVRIHYTAAAWSCLWALSFPLYCKGLHSLPSSDLLFVFQWAAPLVFYALLSLYLQFPWHLSETHLKFQHQGIETGRCCCSWPFLRPHKEQPWSSFFCRTLTHLYLRQMPGMCQHAGFPPWEGAKVCAHSALWRVNYRFA